MSARHSAAQGRVWTLCRLILYCRAEMRSSRLLFSLTTLLGLSSASAAPAPGVARVVDGPDTRQSRPAPPVPNPLEIVVDEIAVDPPPESEAREVVPPPLSAPPALPVGSAGPRDRQAFAVSLGAGGGRIGESSVSWMLGGDGPTFDAGRFYWNSGRFRFLMNAEGADRVVLAPLLGTLGGVAWPLGASPSSAWAQLGLGPAGGLLILEEEAHRPGYLEAALGGVAELGFQWTFEMTPRDRGLAWVGVEGFGLITRAAGRTLQVALLVGRFGFSLDGAGR